MKNPSVTKNRTPNVWGLIIVLVTGVILVCHEATAGQALVSLGAAAKFAVLGGTTVSSRGTTEVNGHLGVSQGTAPTGSLKVSGMIHARGKTAAQAPGDFTGASNHLAGRTIGELTGAGNAGRTTLT